MFEFTQEQLAENIELEELVRKHQTVGLSLPERFRLNQLIAIIPENSDPGDFCGECCSDLFDPEKRVPGVGYYQLCREHFRYMHVELKKPL